MLTFNRILQSFDQWEDVGPSYDDPDVIVYSGDLWAFAGQFSHSNAMNRLMDMTEHYGVELRFYDETISDEQGRVHNTNPSHYGWIPTFKILNGCEIWAEDEVDSGTLESYAEALMNNDQNADQWGVDFSPLGFVKWSEQGESGFHRGQTDTPDAMRAAIEAAKGPCDIVWCIDETGQFDMRFSAWYRTQEEES